MLQDFDEMDGPAFGADPEDRPNVCVLGAGAAGILLATELAASGLRVLLVEGGGLELEQRSQDMYRAESTGIPYEGAFRGRFRTLGGSTTQWGGQVLELDQADFEPRSHIPGSGWPLTKRELQPFYDRALVFEGLRRSEPDDAKVWAGLGLSICDLGPEFRMAYSRWCPERNFATLKARELRESRRLRVLYHANATELLLNDAGTRIQSVRLRGYSGRQALVAADRFVVCMGGIETVRLLLQPVATGQAPWQQNGLLGRHFQDHIALNGIPVREIATQPAARYFGYANLNGFRYHNKIQLSAVEQGRAGTLNVAGTIGPFRRPAPLREDATGMLRDVVHKRRRLSSREWCRIAPHLPTITWEAAAQRFFQDAPDGGPEWNRTMLTVHCEQSPRSTSSITLSDERDNLGALRARVDWQIGELELHTLRTYLKRATEVFRARRFARLEPPQGLYRDDALLRSLCSDSYHHMGGAVMGAGPSSGVVDTNLRLHAVANAYVLSSAVFPSTGYSNPTHTLLALGMRLADHLRGQARAEGMRVAESAAPSGTMPTVTLPGSNKQVPQLGFGCAYLLGPGIDRHHSQRLLDAAYHAGIRHFDTARLYGQGQSESLLGEFLRRRPDASVTTKFGLVPPNGLQRAASAAARRFGRLQPLANLLRGEGKAKFNAASARRSLERSLRALGREQVELFLLHEPERSDLTHDDLLIFLQRSVEEGKIGAFGIGGEFCRVKELHDTRRAYAPVMQFEHSIFSRPISLDATFRIHHRVFAPPAVALTRRFQQDRGLAWWWSEMVGADLQEPAILSQLLLKIALQEHREALTLFSTGTEHHIDQCVATAQDETLADPARRLFKLIRENDLGVGIELYASQFTPR